MSIHIHEEDFPGLYQSADSSSVREQRKYFFGISTYLILLIIAAVFAYISKDYPERFLMIISTMLFLITLGIMIWLKFYRPDDIWYNGRAVAESVKTRSWRWMMKAEPYTDKVEDIRKHFINDLKTILKQNESLISKLGISASQEDPITSKMVEVRKLNLSERYQLYRTERIQNQSTWYFNKAQWNKRRSTMWFVITIILHSLAIILLLINISDPTLNLPIEVIAVGASSALTWLQAKKHNELSSSYTLTFHEIDLIKAEVASFANENEFSEYIMNCENAFSREHTQWFARKTE